jgi:hypothetical protein
MKGQDNRKMKKEKNDVEEVIKTVNGEKTQKFKV